MTRIGSSRDSKEDSVTADRGSSVNRISINLGGATLLAICVFAFIVGACGLIMGLNLARQRTLEDAFLKLDRQYRMTELKLDDWTVVAHRSGLMLPGDYARGPQGNLDSESFTKSKGK